MSFFVLFFSCYTWLIQTKRIFVLFNIMNLNNHLPNFILYLLLIFLWLKWPHKRMTLSKDWNSSFQMNFESWTFRKWIKCLRCLWNSQMNHYYLYLHLSCFFFHNATVNIFLRPSRLYNTSLIDNSRYEFQKFIQAASISFSFFFAKYW